MFNWELAYREAIEFMGGKKTAGLSMPELKAEWKRLRLENKRQGIELPRVQSVYKVAEEQGFEFDYEETPRNENMETAPAEDYNGGYEYIENYKRQIEQIYFNTLDWMNRKDDSTPEKQREYLAHERHEEQFTSSYYSLLSMIDNLVLQYGYDLVAQAIASDAEIDYTIALVFMPPSEFENLFDMTIEQLTAIMGRLSITIG